VASKYNISLKQIYREIQKDIIKEMNSCVPQTVSLLQENFINNIQTNDYFTLEEKQVISLYLNNYNSFTEENINEFNNGLLNEGLKDWLGNAWSKIKNVFSNIKDFVAKIWTSIKEFVIEQCKKAYAWAKAKFEPLIPKITSAIKQIKDKAQLSKELIHMDSIYNWLKTNAYSWLETYGKAAKDALDGEGSMMAMKEMIFNSNFTRILVEATEEIPTDITKPETISTLKKIGIAIGPLLKTIAFVFNPLKYIVVQLAKFLAPKLLEGLNIFIEKIGGPKAIKYIVLPVIFVEVAELAGAFHGIDDLLKEALGLIPVVGPYIEIILQIGHTVFIALAIYEIFHKVEKGLEVSAT